MQNNLGGVVPRYHRDVVINSKDAVFDVGCNPGKFAVNFNNSLFSRERVIEVAVKQASVSGNMPNVYPGQNVLAVQFDGVGSVELLTVPTGWYPNVNALGDVIKDESKAQLTDEIKVEEAKDATFAEFTSDTDFQIVLNQSSPNMLQLLGFGVSETIYPAAFTGDFLSPTPHSVGSHPRIVTVFCSFLQGNSTLHSTGRTSDFACSISISPTQAYNVYRSKHMALDTVKFSEVRHLRGMSVEVTDIWGTQVPIPLYDPTEIILKIGLF
jgi:hypothetical protein